ncbi:helix-turn-helix domain-containing protein [Halobacillus shinanisalinarum]|uniref:Helix-turn-helix domain-containing protein n=1 Tax=Halobacillus shinanisalinarum TaxID=2932258 RepID=A0ABY4GX44_9BACI|nr:helix-turn-helix domain-containing protein [Halobacillus shinanisalinarum]UOQ92726.1 helix-turn-helix domain-containing protein [Halobacillus shinanisalinarum]
MTKIDQLKQLYPSLIVINQGEQKPSEQFQFFQTPDDEIVGILKSDFNKRESQLLHLFLTPIESKDVTETDRERDWIKFIREQSDELTLDPQPQRYRFVFFSLTNKSLELDPFQQALQSLFPKVMPLVWENNHEGVIIEEMMEEGQETISFQTIIDVLMSDFYTKIHFYISDFAENIGEAPRLFQWAKKCFYISMKHRIGPVITFQDVIPFLYIESMPVEERALISHGLLASVQADRELLQTIRVFLEAGSNVTLAAKRLYMHRNSLQYRVDKFIEKTGVDIKQFQGAVITYLTLMELDR